MSEHKRARVAEENGRVDGRAVRLPHGVRDYLPEAAAQRLGIAAAVLGEVERWGYSRIITPAFEYEAVLARGLGPEAQAQAVRFVEPGTGEVVMLRPDLTPQVARLAATRLAGERGPLRLCYEGAVVRLSRGGQRELFQAGVELLDAPATAGDAEVLALSAAALAAAGVSQFVLDLGEARLVRAALAGLSAVDGEALRGVIAQKDADEAGRLARALDAPSWKKKLLAALPSLYGGAEVIDRAARLLDGSGERDALLGLRELLALVARLESWKLGGRISLDLGEVRGFDYYTGVRFSGYAPGVGDALLSGGRYDHLLERYGRAAAAAGFAVDVEKVALALASERAIEASGIYLAGPPLSRHALAQVLRAGGVRVVEELEESAPAEARRRERAARAGVVRAMWIAGSGSLRWVDLHGVGDTVAGGAVGDTVAAARVAAIVAGRESLDAIVPARYLRGPLAPPPAPGTRGKQRSWRA